jgi:hypothetical protein
MQKMSKVGRSGRGSSPPPEQDSSEEAWGPHEQPTRPVQANPTPGAAFPSEGPTLPRARNPALRGDQATKPAVKRGVGVLAPHIPTTLALDDNFEHPSQRVTAPPPADPAPPDDGVPDYHGEDDDIFDRPTLDVVDESNELLGIGYTPRRASSPLPSPVPSPSGIELAEAPLLSQLPTAPPPDEFELDLRNVARVPAQGSLQVFLEPPASQDLRVPPHGAFSPRGTVAETRLDRPSTHPGSPTRDMNDRFAMGDFSGALEKARYILTLDPLDREARIMAAKCEEVLLDMYSSRIAGMQRTVRTVMGSDQMRWLSLDHRAGFLLSLIDGHSSVDDLLDVCGMPRLEALRLICILVDQKVIELS